MYYNWTLMAFVSVPHGTYSGCGGFVIRGLYLQVVPGSCYIALFSLLTDKQTISIRCHYAQLRHDWWFVCTALSINNEIKDNYYITVIIILYWQMGQFIPTTGSVSYIYIYIKGKIKRNLLTRQAWYLSKSNLFTSHTENIMWDSASLWQQWCYSYYCSNSILQLGIMNWV